MAFNVGDRVEVISGGMGIGGHNIGKRTIITAINGTYIGEGGAVQTKDFRNPGYRDWIGKDSFKLIKAVKRISFEANDRVAVIECKEIKIWPLWREAIGRIYTLNKTEAESLTEGSESALGGNESGINFSSPMLEKF